MLNKIMLAGRLTRDPEIRYTQSQNAVTTFTLAVERDYAPKGEEKQTDFIDCVAWTSAEFISKYFQKGSMAIVAGRLQLRDWTDKEGNKRRNAEVNVESIYFGGSKKEGTQANVEPKFEELPDDEEELPF